MSERLCVMRHAPGHVGQRYGNRAFTAPALYNLSED